MNNVAFYMLWVPEGEKVLKATYWGIHAAHAGLIYSLHDAENLNKKLSSLNSIVHEIVVRVVE